MMIKIYSRKKMEALLNSNKPLNNYAIISFADKGWAAINFSDKINLKTNRVFTIMLDDIGIEELKDEGLTYEQFFNAADALAEFIYQAHNVGYRFICQCEYGQSRSAGCAAAILQHFDKSGINVFTKYRYYPNKLIYHKVFDALERYGKTASPFNNDMSCILSAYDANLSDSENEEHYNALCKQSIGIY